jgi:hypothetical protein
MQNDVEADTPAAANAATLVARVMDFSGYKNSHWLVTDFGGGIVFLWRAQHCKDL